MKKNKIIEQLGIELNPMQTESLEAVLRSNKDVVILSPTGSGKTFAYLIPLVQLLNADINDVQAVVLVPSRELAKQSCNIVQNMKTGLRSMALYGGRPTMEEHRELRNTLPQILFVTPGRLNDHLNKENILPDAIKWLVIDEFDKCLEMGFQLEMEQVVNKLPFVERHILLSATESESIPKFVSMRRTIRVDYLKKEEKEADRVQLYEIRSNDKDKLKTLSDLLRSFGNHSTIVFLNYRDAVMRTAGFLKENGFFVSMFHGGLEQKEREAALYRFSNGAVNVLVSTNLGSRGLDIPDVENIVHYHLPENKDEYIHRVGRTARWDKKGNVFFVLGPEENLPEYVEQTVIKTELPAKLLPILPPKMGILYIGKGKKDKISKGDIVGFLCKKAGLKSSEIGKIDVMPRFTYVSVPNEKISHILKITKGEKIKGISTVVEELR